MKALIVILAVYINYVISEGSSSSKYAVKSFPKKLRPYGNGKILINSGKYEGKYDFKDKQKTTERPQAGKITYTVFQVVGVSKMMQGVPDSPYFPVEPSFDHKARVKKVLPDYPWSVLRSKRSAVIDPPPLEKDDKKEETLPTESKLESKVEKIDTTPKLTPEPKPIKKIERKAGATLDKQNEDIKEETKNSKKTNSEEEEMKTGTLSNKPIERTGSKITTTKRAIKIESGTAKKDNPKSERKNESVDSKSNKKPEPKPDRKSDTETKNQESLKSHISENRSVSNDKTKAKGKDTLDDVANLKAKSKSKDKNVQPTNVKALSKGKQKEIKAEVTDAKAKDTKTNVPNVRAKGNDAKAKDRLPSIRHKKNITSSKVNRPGQRNKSTNKKKQQKRQSSVKAVKGAKISPKRSKNSSRTKKDQKTKQTNGTRTAKNLKAERRLIAAREALIEDYPYVVTIQKNDQHWCSGALLNPRLVITTANCLWKATHISRMEVRAGSRHVNRGGQMAGIQEVMKHPGWGLRKSPDNDVALVLLNKNIKFSDSVHAVDLPNRVMMPPFDDAWVTSWGAERRDGVYDGDSTSLQVYHTRLMDRGKCNNITMRFSVIVTENFICLAQSGLTAPCTRDTGAPAVSDGILWGLASWGIRKLCGTERFPAVFSYLASHSNLDFITNATRFLMADKRYYPYGDRFPGGKSAPAVALSASGGN